MLFNNWKSRCTKHKAEQFIFHFWWIYHDSNGEKNEIKRTSSGLGTFDSFFCFVLFFFCCFRRSPLKGMELNKIWILHACPCEKWMKIPYVVCLGGKIGFMKIPCEIFHPNRFLFAVFVYYFFSQLYAKSITDHREQVIYASHLA